MDTSTKIFLLIIAALASILLGRGIKFVVELIKRFRLSAKLRFGKHEVLVEEQPLEKKDAFLDKMVKEINKESSRLVTVSAQEILGFVEVSSSLSSELALLDCKFQTRLTQYLESLELNLRSKFEGQLSIFLCSKYSMCSDDVLECEHYYYLMSVFDSVFRLIKELWEYSFRRMSFEDKDEYVENKLAEVHQLVGDYIRSSFKSKDISKAELIRLFNSIEYSLTEFNRGLFDKAHSLHTDTVAKRKELETGLERIRLAIMSYR
jgi:hypothetical protein